MDLYGALTGLVSLWTELDRARSPAHPPRFAHLRPREFFSVVMSQDDRYDLKTKLSGDRSAP